MSKKTKKNAFLILPASLLLLSIIIYPTIYMWYMSFMRNTPLLTKFVGFSNFINLLKDDNFRRALFNTAYFSIGAVSMQFIFGLSIALALNRDFFGKNLVLWIIMIPMIIPPVVVGLTFRILYEPQYGMINYILNLFGIDGFSWLTNSFLAMPSIIMADVWNWTPFIALIMLSGLQYMPRDILESARLDGASKWQTFYYITLPILKPLISIALVFRFIMVIRTFALIYMTTRGGPGVATQTMSISIFLEAFNYMNYGIASAQSILLFIIVFIFIIVMRSKIKDELF